MTDAQWLPDTMTTKRLGLRPYRFSDVPEMFTYLQEPDGSRYLEGSGAALTEPEVEAIVARHILVDQTQRNVWAMTIDDVVMGAVTINFAKQRRIAEIGYHVRRSLWGCGYASEAVQAVIGAAFDHCQGLQRVQANIHPENQASIRVAERAGMQYEGTLRCYSHVAGEAADEAVYAVVRRG